MFEGVPILEGDVDKKHDLDKEVKASGCFAQEEIDTLDQIGQVMLDQIGKIEGEGENEQEENEDEENEIEEGKNEEKEENTDMKSEGEDADIKK